MSYKPQTINHDPYSFSNYDILTTHMQSLTCGEKVEEQELFTKLYIYVADFVEECVLYSFLFCETYNKHSCSKLGINSRT